MKTVLLTMSLFVISIFSSAQLQTFHDFQVETILGDIVPLSQYAGKKLLVVNTASFCAYTPQFEALELLDETYADNNFEVIGFPCNDFGNQDPNSNADILEFCEGTYGVTFQMMARISITASDTADVYKWLQLASNNGVDNANVTWNFHKFCIDEYGHWVMHFPSQTLPGSPLITDWILSETPLAIIESADKPGFLVRNSTADDFLSVKLNASCAGDGLIELYSIEGKRMDNIFNGQLTSNAEIRYDTSSLPGGIYLIHMIAEEIRYTQKLCIAR